MPIAAAAWRSLESPKVDSSASMPCTGRDGYTFRVLKIYRIGVGRGDSGYLATYPLVNEKTGR
jgi:hypothetical protein